MHRSQKRSEQISLQIAQGGFNMVFSQLNLFHFCFTLRFIIILLLFCCYNEKRPANVFLPFENNLIDSLDLMDENQPHCTFSFSACRRFS